MNINLEVIAKEIQEELHTKLVENFKEQYRSRVLNAIKPFFMDHHDLQRVKDNPLLMRTYGLDKTNLSDAGYVTNLINESITELVLSDKMKEDIERYICLNFNKHLEAALDAAMSHRAKKIAFGKMNGFNPSNEKE